MDKPESVQENGTFKMLTYHSMPDDHLSILLTWRKEVVILDFTIRSDNRMKIDE